MCVMRQLFLLFRFTPFILIPYFKLRFVLSLLLFICIVFRVFFLFPSAGMSFEYLLSP